jgi:hypothetical protein
MGVAAVGLEGAAATSNSANSSSTAMRALDPAGIDQDRDVARVLMALRDELGRLASETERIKAELAGRPDARDAGSADAASSSSAAATRDKRAEAGGTGAKDKANAAHGKARGGKTNGGSGKTSGRK